MPLGQLAGTYTHFPTGLLHSWEQTQRHGQWCCTAWSHCCLLLTALCLLQQRLSCSWSAPCIVCVSRGGLETNSTRDTWPQESSLIVFFALIVNVALSKSSQQANAHGLHFSGGTLSKADRPHNTLRCWSLHISICLDCPHVFFFCLLPTTEEPPSHSFYLSITSSPPCLFPPAFHPVLPCCHDCVLLWMCRCQLSRVWHKLRSIKVTASSEMHVNDNHTF